MVRIPRLMIYLQFVNWLRNAVIKTMQVSGQLQSQICLRTITVLAKYSPGLTRPWLYYIGYAFSINMATGKIVLQRLVITQKESIIIDIDRHLSFLSHILQFLQRLPVVKSNYQTKPLGLV